MTSAPEHPVAPAAADVPLSDLMDAAVSAVGGSPRPGQQTMAEAVDLAMSGGRHLLVQAGTGTGKSLGYLVPAMRHALVTGRPVVISTATIALQTQIVRKDLPRLAEALAPHFTVEDSRPLRFTVALDDAMARDLVAMTPSARHVDLAALDGLDGPGGAPREVTVSVLASLHRPR